MPKTTYRMYKIQSTITTIPNRRRFMILMLFRPAKILALFLLFGLGQTAYAGPLRLLRSIRHEVKLTFSDMRHDKLWAVYVVGTIALNAADTSTTCIGVSNGSFSESNPILGKHPSCGKLIAIEAPVTLAHLVGAHKLSGMLTDYCRREAADPDSRWWKTGSYTHNPESCKVAMPIAGMTVWPFHAAVIKSNIDLLTWHKPEKEK